MRYATPNEASLPMITRADRENPAIYPLEADLKYMEYLEDVGEAARLYDGARTRLKARS